MVHRVAQALIYTATSRSRSTEPLCYLQGKGGSSCSNEALYKGSADLFYSFAIITTLLSPSDGIPLSFCEHINFVCSRRSVAALQTKCDLYRDMNQLLKGRGEGGQQLIVFFSSFLRWPFSTIAEGKAEDAGLSVRLPPLNNAHTVTSGPCLES